MSEGNGVAKPTEFDLIAEIRRDVDAEMRMMDRRFGLIETALNGRLDMLSDQVKRGLANDERILSEIKTLSGYFVHVLDRVLEIEKRLGADVVETEPKRRKAGRK